MNDTPMLPEGAFRIGSITKMFTAAVIIQLAEDGMLTLDDPLAQWLPEVADQLPYGDQITLRHLLTDAHIRSGERGRTRGLLG